MFLHNRLEHLLLLKVGFYFPAGFKAWHYWHVQVHYNYVEVFLLSFLISCQAIGGLMDVWFVNFKGWCEYFKEHVQDEHFIVNEEYFQIGLRVRLIIERIDLGGIRTLRTWRFAEDILSFLPKENALFHGETWSLARYPPFLKSKFYFLIHLLISSLVGNAGTRLVLNERQCGVGEEALLICLFYSTNTG